MMKVRGCVVFLMLSAVLSLTANAQTQAQIDKKNAADLAQMNCNDVKEKCVSEREFAIFTKDEASYWRTQCVNAGATPAQLDPGDSHAHAGNASLGFGDTDRDVGDNYWSTAEVAKAAGDTFWRAGDFVGACIQYDVSTPNHDTAKGWYDSALNWYQQATRDYALALGHYETLYQELTTPP